MVGSTEKITKSKPAKYFAVIICHSLSGRVSKSSIVPVRCSSANERMVIAGIKNMNTQGAITNKLSSEAKPASKMLKLPGKTQRNKPIANRKIVITLYPIRDVRKLLISFRNNDIIRKPLL